MGREKKAGWRHLLRRAEEGAIAQPAEERVIQTVPYEEYRLWDEREDVNKARFKTKNNQWRFIDE